MNISPTDYIETKKIGHLLKKIDNNSVGYADVTTDEMYKYQPFVLSLLLGYQHDLKLKELDEIIKVYFILWEYFKDKKYVRKKKITKEQFEEAENRNVYFLNYLEKCASKEKEDAITNDINSQKSKALLTAVFFRFNTRPVLLEMNENDRGIVLVGIKSIIDCFEEIGK